MYVLLAVFQASMYFSMQDERQVCSLEESEVEGVGMQVAKQFLWNAALVIRSCSSSSSSSGLGWDGMGWGILRREDKGRERDC